MLCFPIPQPCNRPWCVMFPFLCLCILIVQLPLMSEKCGVWFSDLCYFAEYDGFQLHPCPYKGHELIIFDGCIIFHGVYVPHFPSPVYNQWAFGLVPGLRYLNCPAVNIRVHVSL